MLFGKELGLLPNRIKRIAKVEQLFNNTLPKKHHSTGAINLCELLWAARIT